MASPKMSSAALVAVVFLASVWGTLMVGSAVAAEMTCGQVGAHANHTQDGPAHLRLSCEACHARVCSVAPTPNVAFGALASTGGMVPAWDPLDRTCSNVYCHGQNPLPVSWTYVDATAVRPPEVACAVCHGYPPPSPHPQMTGCQGCHSSTVLADGSIDLAGGRHINGTLDFSGDFSGDFGDIHAATPGSGPVVLFADTDHDDAGWFGAKPYFDVTVACATCHNTDLPAVHGNHCATCHPTPYDTLGGWEKGCRQGGCHPSYHQDSTTAHLPFEDAYSPGNDCSRCHNQSWAVPPSNCLNCHAAYGPGDLTPPVTTSNARALYVGPAEIGFSITDNGKVGVGRTFYRLDGGEVTAAGKTVTIAAPGAHQLEFWSKDQSGNTEPAPNLAIFTVVTDTTPPVTTSNAQPTYNQGAVITLTATDDGDRGVKATYYRLGDGPIQTGTTIVIPATSGTFAYTLFFWSEDWSDNDETENRADFTVTSGGGVLRLVWSNSDTGGSPCPGDPGAEAAWTIYRGTTRVATGSGACPNWSGVADVNVPVSPTPYTVIIDWWDSYYEDYDQTRFQNVPVTSPGQIVRLSY